MSNSSLGLALLIAPHIFAVIEGLGVALKVTQ
jgi:hypothetical protein